MKSAKLPRSTLTFGTHLLSLFHGLIYLLIILTYFQFLTVFKIIIIQNLSNLNALGSKFDLDGKNHHLNKLCRPHISNATYQVPRSSAFLVPEM